MGKRSFFTSKRSATMRNGDLKQWPLPEAEHSPRSISCVVHGSIPLFHPLEYIVDSPEFQRLRRLKQLGVANLVYPCAEHSRFTHSLGVYHLARRWVDHIQASDPQLGVTPEDKLCVSLAALCHDIGHGPFSHWFDNEFLQEKSPEKRWSHEVGSLLLIKRLFSREKIKTAFEPFLGTGERFKRNLTFIEELVHFERKLDSSGNWALKGRTIDKAFLYDIVSNNEDGHDVDKFDYLLRDSLYTKVNVTFGESSLTRLKNNIRVLKCPIKNYKRICYAKKVVNDVMAVGDSRQVLHATVFQHYTARAIERLLVRAVLLADRHLVFTGENNKKYSLSESIDDMTAYIKTDDSILQMIENSTVDHVDMQKARSILESINNRNIPKAVDRADFSPSKIQPVVVEGRMLDALSSSYKKYIRNLIESELNKMFPDEHIIVLTRTLNRGLDGKRHPVGEVLVYDNKVPTDEVTAHTIEYDEVAMRSPLDPTIMSVAVFLNKTVTEKTRQAVRETFDALLVQNGIRNKKPLAAYG